MAVSGLVVVISWIAWLKMGYEMINIGKNAYLMDGIDWPNGTALV